MKLKTKILSGALLSGLLISSSPISAITYTPTSLNFSSQVGFNGINALGQVVGVASYNGFQGPAIWQPGSTSPNFLPPLVGGTFASANAINDSGQIVGVVGDGLNINNSRAALWQPGASSTINLDTLGTYNSLAYDINNSGQVVGYSSPTYSTQHAMLWESDSTMPIDLGTLGGINSVALAINAHGDVVGYADTNGNGFQDAALWLYGSTTAIDLGRPVDGSYSNAYDINAIGEIVGISGLSGGITHAMLWEPGATTPIDLGTPGENSWAYAINDSGYIVGGYTNNNGVEHAALWMPVSYTLIDLGSLVALSTGYLSYGIGINNSGQIIGYATNGQAGIGNYLLTPTAVPSPSAVWLFGSGLGLLALTRRKS